MASSAKCTSEACPQAAFREGLCIDHFRKKAPGGPGAASKKLVSPTAGGDLNETVDEKMRAAFTVLTRKVYSEQAKWYLNAFWEFGAQDHAEEVWDTCQKFITLDTRKKAGNELNHVEAHHYLQTNGKTMTALELKQELRRIDVDANGEMALLEYLLFQYRKRVTDCLNNPQGGGEESKQLAEAQAKLEELLKAAEEARKKEEEAKAAEVEAKAAAAEFHRQEEEYKDAIAKLEAKSTDASLGAVARNKAVQELAQLKGADPLPLRRAKITQDACVRRVEAARKAAEAATAQAEARANECQALLNELKKAAAVPFGAIWWMEREMKEAKKYMAKSRQ